MYFNLKKKVGSLLVAVAMVTSMFAALPVMATDSTTPDNIEIVLRNVTEGPTTITGEAKIEVSVKGDVDNVTAMQAALDFTGNVVYKDIDYLVDADVLADVDPYTANAEKKIMEL